MCGRNSTEECSSGSSDSTVGRLVLGTAQFDGTYGLTRGESNQSEVFDPYAILSEATRLGVDSLDTAPAYGSAEQVIGDFAWDGAIATKIDKHRSPKDSLDLSLGHLKRDVVDVMYIHDYRQTESKDFLAQFVDLRGNGARFLGASVYDVDEFHDALSLGIFDVLQFPINLFDRRFLPIAPTATGTRLVARSAMLQGLLTSAGLSVAHDDHPLQPFLREFEDACHRISREPHIAAVSWVLAQSFIDEVVIGFDSVSQLRQIVERCALDPLTAEDLAVLDDLPQPPFPLVDPRIWSWS